MRNPNGCDIRGHALSLAPVLAVVLVGCAVEAESGTRTWSDADADAASTTLDASDPPGRPPSVGSTDGGPRADAGPGSALDGSAPAPAPDCATLPPFDLGYQRKGTPTTFVEVPLVTPAGITWNPFPNSGALGRIWTSQSQFVAIQFTTPLDVAAWSAAAPSKRVSWGPSQVDGEAELLDVYVTLSRCMGDFRLPPAGSVAPPNDPTFARGCTNVRNLGAQTIVSTQVGYALGEGPSDESRCVLAPGRTYFLNFIRANVLDGKLGTPVEEASGNASNCTNPELTSCGVQMRVE